jgi:hypothetical protein
MNCSITFIEAQQLASLARMTHQWHFDARYEESELLIPC